MKNRELNPVLVFFLGFVTLGLANHVFLYIISERLGRNLKGEVIFPMRETVLNIITLGVYGIIWTYKVGSQLYEDSKSAIGCAVISAFPIRCVSMAMLAGQL